MKLAFLSVLTVLVGFNVFASDEQAKPKVKLNPEQQLRVERALMEQEASLPWATRVQIEETRAKQRVFERIKGQSEELAKTTKEMHAMAGKINRSLEIVMRERIELSKVSCEEIASEVGGEFYTQLIMALIPQQHDDHTVYSKSCYEEEEGYKALVDELKARGQNLVESVGGERSSETAQETLKSFDSIASNAVSQKIFINVMSSKLKACQPQLSSMMNYITTQSCLRKHLSGGLDGSIFENQSVILEHGKQAKELKKQAELAGKQAEIFKDQINEARGIKKTPVRPNQISPLRGNPTLQSVKSAK